MKKTLIITLGILSILLLSGTAVAYAMMQKEVTISFSDKDESITTSVLKGTPASILDSEGYDREQLEEQYEPSVAWDTPIQEDTKIHLTCNCEVTLKVGAEDGKKVKTMQPTVGDFLEEQKVKVGKNDQVNAVMDQKITNDLTIVVDQIEKRVQKKVETTDFQTKEEKDPNLPEGEKKVTQEGKEGKEIYQVTALYKNGKAMVTDKKLIEKVDPVQRIVKVGSGKAATASSEKKETELASSGGSRIAGLKYSKTMNAQATGYTHTGNPTATGVMPKRGTVAVDPSVIPLGTRLYIPGYGQGVAQDTGGAVRGNIVDLFFETREEAIQWGRRNVTVYILE
ncbi:3D domain-containing protein [Desmospora profundinema]|uniref:3D (Asp-Asp-Asp) domain-containing protein n=1 Tax=Desmospora profundinema TaxID=1571184 RepID=A0ABU1IJE7_9BACL|nr:3D domain-containing protein [Desmospora profundinema]MDR6224892.1 3D (Asp-Asp-Asp) domain-containing protein [Desmospora profundinema]